MDAHHGIRHVTLQPEELTTELLVRGNFTPHSPNA
jgi:hypothetical protein